MAQRIWKTSIHPNTAVVNVFGKVKQIYDSCEMGLVPVDFKQVDDKTVHLVHKSSGDIYVKYFKGENT